MKQCLHSVFKVFLFSLISGVCVCGNILRWHLYPQPTPPLRMVDQFCQHEMFRQKNSPTENRKCVPENSSFPTVACHVPSIFCIHFKRLFFLLSHFCGPSPFFFFLRSLSLLACISGQVEKATCWLREIIQ